MSETRPELRPAPLMGGKDPEIVLLTLASESDQPHEWPALAWTIRNRVQGPGWYGNDYGTVCLRRYQFSYWNSLEEVEDRDEKIHLAGQKFYPGRVARQLFPMDGRGGDYSVLRFQDWANLTVFTCSRLAAPFGPEVRHFYSPVSMGGREPSWLSKASRVFSLPGIDPDRFMFAEGVPPVGRKAKV